MFTRSLIALICLAAAFAANGCGNKNGADGADVTTAPGQSIEKKTGVVTSGSSEATRVDVKKISELIQKAKEKAMAENPDAFKEQVASQEVSEEAAKEAEKMTKTFQEIVEQKSLAASESPES